MIHGIWTVLFLFTASIQSPPGSLPINAPAPGKASTQDVYLLQAGDVIEVKLFYNPSLDAQLPIRPDGMISLPLVGEIKAAGLSPAELSKQLADRFAVSLVRPDTVVIVKEFAAQRVYIGGEVRSPGVIQIRGRVSVLQGILEAGGFVRTAKLENVVILRDRGNAEPQFITLNLKQALEQGGRNQDMPLMPRDIVFVPKTKIANMNNFIDQYIKELIPIPVALGVSWLFGNAGIVR